jgi:hypothetical protein
VVKSANPLPYPYDFTGNSQWLGPLHPASLCDCSVIEPSLLFTKAVLQPAQHHTVRVNVINLANLPDEDELRITRYGFSCSHF